MAQAITKPSQAKRPATLIALPQGGTMASRPTKPRYIRLPAQGTLCPHSGLSRGKLNGLILPQCPNPDCLKMEDVKVGEKCPHCRKAVIPAPPVKSILIPNAYKNEKGCRLIVLDSLMGYLKSLENQAA